MGDDNLKKKENIEQADVKPKNSDFRKSKGVKSPNSSFNFKIINKGRYISKGVNKGVKSPNSSFNFKIINKGRYIMHNM